MSERLEILSQILRRTVLEPVAAFGRALATGARRACAAPGRTRLQVALLGACAVAGYALWARPPIQAVGRGEIVVRSNRYSGAVAEFSEGSLLAVPGIHQLRRFPIRDQVYRPAESATATGNSPFQSVEGLSLGVDLTVRYAIYPKRIARMSKDLPDDIPAEVVRPAVEGVIYTLFARYTVREIFSSKRAEIQQAIEAELAPKFAAVCILLRGVEMGKVDLPQDYRSGMDKLLAEELEAEKMRFTLELKGKRVRATELDAEADKVRREKAAEAAAQEQVIAARAQEEAMPSVSSGPIGVSFCRITGPSSRPSVGRKMVRPVLMSPRMIGQLIELGPRYFGNSDGWYWMVPFFGMLTKACGTNCSTNAMMPMSAPRARMASSASLARSDANWNTFSPFSSAAAFSGSALAPTFSGAQNTPATSSPRSRNASRTDLPKSCWPTIAIFMTVPFGQDFSEG